MKRVLLLLAASAVSVSYAQAPDIASVAPEGCNGSLHCQEAHDIDEWHHLLHIGDDGSYFEHFASALRGIANPLLKARVNCGFDFCDLPWAERWTADSLPG